MKMIYLDKFPTNELLTLYVHTNTENKLVAKTPLKGDSDYPEIPICKDYFDSIQLGENRKIILKAVSLFNIIYKDI